MLGMTEKWNWYYTQVWARWHPKQHMRATRSSFPKIIKSKRTGSTEGGERKAWWFPEGLSCDSLSGSPSPSFPPQKPRGRSCRTDPKVGAHRRGRAGTAETGGRKGAEAADGSTVCVQDGHRRREWARVSLHTGTASDGSRNTLYLSELMEKMKSKEGGSTQYDEATGPGDG